LIVAEINTSSGLPVQLQELRKSESFWQHAFRHVVHDKLTVIAFTFLLLLTLACVFAPPIVENVLGLDPTRTSVVNRYKPPGTDGYILGTDQLGRDQFIRLLYGGRISLAIGYFASFITIAIGVTIGLISGFYGGLMDDLVNWLINTLSSIPGIFLLLIAASIWSPSPTVLIIILSMLSWVTTCRLVRGEVISLRERDYVLAAQALGASSRRVIWSHILPNVLSLVIISLAINAGIMILIESGLSYLGLGVQPPTPTWGNMLSDSRSYFLTGSHLVVWPGMLITLTVLAFYMIGDGFRDALDPRLKK
jgi:peptide/nickel transport system permease protein